MLLWLLLTFSALFRAIFPEQGAELLPAALLWGAQVCALARIAWICVQRWLVAAPITTRACGLYLLYECLAGSISTATAFLWRTSAVSNALLCVVLLGLAELLHLLLPRPFTLSTELGRVRPPLPPRLVFALGLAGGGAATVAWIAWRGTVQNSDAMWYHLPLAVEWMRSGELLPPAIVPTIARAYPFLRTGAVVFHSMPFGTEHLGLLGPCEFAALLLASAACARALGLSAPLAAASASLTAAFPIAARAAPMEGTDVWLAFCLVGSLLFGLRYLRQPSSGAGWMLGIALGGLAAAKYSGLMLALALIGSTLVLGFWRGCWRYRAKLRLFWPIVIAFSALAGPSYLRNLSHYGNPLWPAQVAPLGLVLFDGPYDRSYFRAQTHGFDLSLLLGYLRFYRQAFGWTVILPVLAPLLALLALGLRRFHRWEGTLAFALPLLLFALWLQQPFTRPAANYIFTMRFLLGWAVVSSLMGLWAFSRCLAPRHLPWLERLLPLLALWPLRQWTQQWWLSLLFASGLVAGAHLCRQSTGVAPVLAKLTRWPFPALLPPVCALFLAAAGLGLERFRREQQFHPQYGYRDNESDRGWGALVRHVHKEIQAARIAFHGAGTFFPLYGDRLTNELHPLPVSWGAEAVLAYCEKHEVDYLACFVPAFRLNFNGPFQYGTSLTAAIRRLRPRAKIVVSEAGAALIRLRP